MLVRWEPDAEALAAGPQESTLALSVTGGGTRQVCNLNCFFGFFPLNLSRTFRWA